MSRRGLLNLSLLMAVLVLAAIAYFAPEVDQAQQMLTDLDRDAVERIAVQLEGADPISLERREGGWQITRPLSLPAQEFSIRRLLGVLSEPVNASLDPEAASTPEKFGLADPTAVVEFDGTAIAFGDTNPLGNRRYVRTEEGVFLISDSHLFTLEHGIYGLISTKLLPPSGSVTALRTDGLEIRHDDEAGWQMIQPRADVSADQIVALAQRWEQATALRVSAVDGNGQQTPRRVNIELRDGQRLSFAITADDPELVLARPQLGIAYHLPASQAEQLLALPEPVTSETDRPQ